MIVLILLAVIIVAALGGIAYYLATSGRPPPSGPSLSSVQLAATPKSQLNQTETVTVTATALDSNGVDQSANATWTWSNAPSTAVTITQTALSYRVQVRGIGAGTATVTAEAALGNSRKSGSVSVTVDAIRYNVGRQGTVAALGEVFDITVTVVKTSTGGTYTGYDGMVHFTSTDAAATLPPDSPVLQGARIFTVRFGTSGLQTVTVTDTVAPTVSGSTQVRGDRRPVADFSIQPDPMDRRIVTLASLSTDPDGDSIASTNWEFGDAATGTGATVTHTYSVSTQVTINLTVTDQWGLPSAPASKTYTPSAPPVAFFFVNGTSLVATNIRVYVDATGSTGTITNYNWTWDDGSQTDTTTPTTYHDYGPAYANKDVNITLNVTDVNNIWDNHTSKVRVTVVPLPPVASFEIAARNSITLQVWVDARNSSDPNNNIDTLTWDWGDGNTTTKRFGPSNLTASWQYALEGDYTITLTVTDTTSLSNTQTKSVSLFRPQLPPVAAFTTTKAAFTVDVNASATTDINGPGDIVAYNWTWGDGTQNEYAGPLASHTYPSTPLIYTITLRVRDTAGNIGTALHKVSVAATTFDYTFWDFFQVPYKDYWDFRGDKYGDLPLGVTCFNETAALVYDKCAGEALNPIPPGDRTYYTAPPYTDWYPSPGSIRPGHTGNNPFIYAPYRFKAVASNVPNYNVSEPVFLPVLNYAGQLDTASYVTFDWRFSYLTKPEKDAMYVNCGALGFNDGFDTTGTVTLTMDLKTSGRLFGADTSSVANARQWWGTNGENTPDCTRTSSIESKVMQWHLDMGGSKQATGKYDVANSCEWYYVDFMLQVNASVDNDGTTHATIWNMAYCQEILMSRWFYWGNTSYRDHWDDSTQARGWWGMELAWFEDFDFTGTLTRTDFDFAVQTVMQYHFQLGAVAEPGGTLDKINDIPLWSWRPFLTDYTNDWNPSTHYISELDRYPTQTYLHSTPGSPLYGLQHAYDYAPLTWNPKAGEEWHFVFPKGNVRFYDPRTAAGANPIKPFTTDPSVKQYIKVDSPLVYYSQTPASVGDWDSQNMTWDVYGPVSPALGPDGSPGNYALDETTPGATQAQLVKPEIVFRNKTAGALGLTDSAMASGAVAGSPAVGPSSDFRALASDSLQAGALTIDVRRRVRQV